MLQEQELSGQDEGLPSPLTSVGLEHWGTLAGDQKNKEGEVGCLLLCTIASSVKDHIVFSLLLSQDSPSALSGLSFSFLFS